MPNRRVRAGTTRRITTAQSPPDTSTTQTQAGGSPRLATGGRQTTRSRNGSTCPACLIASTANAKLSDRCWRLAQCDTKNIMKTTTHETEKGSSGSLQRPCSAQELFNAAFAGNRSPRSPEYKAGVLSHLRFALKETGIHNPYAEGTAQSDAWYAGVQESWLILQANGIVPNTRS